MLREYIEMEEKIKTPENVFGIYYIQKCKRVTLVVRKILETKIIVSEKTRQKRLMVLSKASGLLSKLMSSI